MSITLQNFENYIDSKILKRGLDYYKKGKVTKINYSSNNFIQAIVKGAEEYEVRIKIENEELIEKYCDCPYDWGNFCKHEVALLFYLLEDELDIQVTNSKKSTNTPKKRTKTSTTQLKEILRKTSTEELQDFIMLYAKKDKYFKTYAVTYFNYLLEETDKEFFKKQVSEVVKSVMHDGWIDWQGMKNLNKSFMVYLNGVEKDVLAKRFDIALRKYLALLEELGDLVSYVDDSNATIGTLICDCIGGIEKLIENNIEESLEKELLDVIFKLFKKYNHLGFDWTDDILYLASEVVKNEEDKKQIFACLDAVSKERKYHVHFAQKMRLDFFEKFGMKKEAKEYMEANIGNSSIRRKEIELALEYGDYSRVKKLAKDGIEYDKKDAPGIVTTWKEYLLKVAELENDKDLVIFYAKDMYLNEFTNQASSYDIMKRFVEKEAWKDFLNELINEIQKKNSWGKRSMLKEIYIQENDVDSLFELLKDDSSLDEIKNHESILKEKYREELIEIYYKGVVSFLDHQIGRNNYQIACRFIRRIIKLDGLDRANTLIAYLKNKHMRKRALLEELKNI